MPGPSEGGPPADPERGRPATVTVIVDRSPSVTGHNGTETDANVANSALLDLFEFEAGVFSAPQCARSSDVNIARTSKTSPLASSLSQAAAIGRGVVLVTDGIENDHPHAKTRDMCAPDRRKLVAAIATALDSGVDVTFACIEPDPRFEVCADDSGAHDRCNRLCDEARAGRELLGNCTVVDAGSHYETLANAASAVRCPSPGLTGSPGTTPLTSGPNGAEPVTMDLTAEIALLGNDSRWHCTGVLIGRSTILTAKHCLPATRVRLGADIRQSGRIVRVAESTPHSDRTVDAALVRLGAPAERPRAFRRRAGDVEAPYGALHFEGFGVEDGASPNNIGRRRSFDIPVDGWGCDRGRDQTAGCVPGTELVSPATGGLDTCGGDSGGPLFELWGDKQRCGWRLVAITSRSIPNGIRACGSGGIYVRVDAIATWIDKTMTAWGDGEDAR